MPTAQPRLPRSIIKIKNYMCGITGIIQKDREIDRELLKRMTSSLAHRGPDDQGVYLDRVDDVFIGFGQSRLSIIDLSNAGHQPMSNINEDIVITFNGEIYNFLEIKEELIKKGYKFKSNTDTEVIINGYKEYGSIIFSKLNGMFALAIWDKKNKKLILSRDRYGQKPLYYYHKENLIVFASELKTLLIHPEIKNDISLKSLSKYFSYEFVPNPDSMIEGIKKVIPGHYYVIDCSKNIFSLKKNKYWDIDFNKYRDSISGMSEKEIGDEVLSKLKKSIERRLMSDVPLGVFLSGGIDSSAIVGLLSEITDIKKVKTFSIGFKEDTFDESKYARQVAKYFGTEHREKILTSSMMLDILPDVLNKLDEPMADASIIPTYLLSKFTREHVTVALGGDAGDELFAGYDPFVAHRHANYYEKVPVAIHNVIKYFADKLPVSSTNMSFDFKVKHFLKGVYNSPSIRNQVWLGAFSKEGQNSLFTENVNNKLLNDDPLQNIHRFKSEHDFSNWIDEICFMYQKFYLSDGILVKMDRASMMNSLEARTPFLDYEFAEFVNSIPANLKLKGNVRKYILKKALESKLPNNILYRKKKGFGIPLTSWIKEDLRDEISSVLSSSNLENEGFFNTSTVNSLLDEHFRGVKDNRKQIWSLYVFEKWRKKIV